jgi:hypothetical protein
MESERRKKAPVSFSAAPLRLVGIILPLYFSLEGQLFAIAQALDLPSTEGLSIYLYEDGQGYAGPNIGASVWPMIWHRNFNGLEHYNSSVHHQQRIASSSSKFVAARVELLLEGNAAVRFNARHGTESADTCRND